MNNQRKHKPTQTPSKADEKRRLSSDRSPPNFSKPTENDEELQGEEEDSTSKGKQSHHKKKACSVSGCKLFGSNLKHHLKLHVRRGKIAEKSNVQLVTIMTTGKKQRGESEWEKWCPVQNCFMKEISMFFENPDQSAEEAMAESGDESDDEMAMRKLAEGCGKVDDIYPMAYSDNESQEEVQMESESAQDKGQSEHEEESDDQSDSSFEPVASNLTAEQFFKTTTPENPRHRWLAGFYDCLSRLVMGDKKKSIRLQHAGQMRILLEYLDLKGDDISCLAQDEGDAV